MVYLCPIESRNFLKESVLWNTLISNVCHSPTIQLIGRIRRLSPDEVTASLAAGPEGPATQGRVDPSWYKLEATRTLLTISIHSPIAAWCLQNRKMSAQDHPIITPWKHCSITEALQPVGKLMQSVAEQEWPSVAEFISPHLSMISGGGVLFHDYRAERYGCFPVRRECECMPVLQT